MRSVALLLAAFLLLALESPLLEAFSVAQYAPDLVLIAVMYVGLTSRFESGLALALALGLLKDGFVMSSPVGMYMELSVVAYFVSFRLSRRLALRGPLAVMLITLTFSVGASLLELALGLIFDRGFTTAAMPGGAQGVAAGIDQATIVLTTLAPQALFTAPFGPLLFWIFEKLDGLTTRKNESVYLG